MTSPSPASPQTLAEMARVDVETALADERRPVETDRQIAARLLAEGVDGRWTPPSGDVGCEPTPEAQAYWAAVRARLEEIAGTQQTAPATPETPPGWGRTMTTTTAALDAPPPPPADVPGLAELMPMVLRLAEKHLPGALLADLRRALAAEEERGKLRLKASEAWQAEPGDVRPAEFTVQALDDWAEMETSR